MSSGSLRRTPYDVIFWGPLAPVMTGMEFCQAITGEIADQSKPAGLVTLSAVSPETHEFLGGSKTLPQENV